MQGGFKISVHDGELHLIQLAADAAISQENGLLILKSSFVLKVQQELCKQNNLFFKNKVYPLLTFLVERVQQVAAMVVDVHQWGVLWVPPTMMRRLLQ